MKTYVVKISSQLTDDLQPYASPIEEAVERGNRVAVVSGGAIRRAFKLLDLSMATATTLEMQAAASIGQIQLMKDWQACCSWMKVGEFLYTHHDFGDPANNIPEVIEQVFNMRILPVANSPDTVTSQETRLTDKVSENSGVASLLAVAIGADKLVMLGTQPYIYTADPRKNHNAQPIYKVVDLSDEFLAQFPEEEPQEGSFGGIRTAVKYCLYAARNGVEVIFTSGLDYNNLPRILRGEEIDCTVFLPAK